MIKIEYKNSKDILDCHYEGDYKNVFWLDVEILKPKYPILKEQVENTNGSSNTTFAKWEKKYSFDLYCTEPITDFLSTITLCDDIWVTFPNGHSARCISFECSEVDWTAINGLGKLTISFSVKSFILNGSSGLTCN